MGKTPSSQKRRVLGMTLNCIWWWGSSSEALRNMKYPFIGITSRSTLIRSGSTCYGSIYESNRFVQKLFVLDWNTWYHVRYEYLISYKLWYRLISLDWNTWYHITICKKLFKNYTKSVNMNIQYTKFLTTRNEITPTRVDMLLKSINIWVSHQTHFLQALNIILRK